MEYSEFFRWLKRPASLSALGGLILSIGSPLGLYIVVHLTEGKTALPQLELAYYYTAIGTAIVFVWIGFYFGKQIELIQNLSLLDSLTGLGNRRFLMKRLTEILASEQNSSQTFSLLVLDLDDFKKVNDRFGHLVGDKTLYAVAKALKRTCRKSDFTARYGGEEFAIICSNTNEREAYHLAERIRQTVEKISSQELGFPGKQTISIGVFEIPSKQAFKLTQVLSKADEALYEAKHHGRNQVVIHQMIEPTKKLIHRTDVQKTYCE